MKNHLLFTVVGVLLLGGCASIPKASFELSNNVKDLAPLDDKAIVFFVRPGSSGSSVKNYIFCNDRFLGRIGAKSFMIATLEPGKYRFHTIQWFPRKQNRDNYSTLSIELEANKRYFIEPNNSGDSDALEELAEQDGESGLAACELSGIPQYISIGFNSPGKTISGFYIQEENNTLMLNSYGKIYKVNRELISNYPELDPNFKNGVMVWENNSLRKYRCFDRYRNIQEIKTTEDIEKL